MSRNVTQSPAPDKRRERREEKTPAAYPPDFEEWYRGYPRRVAKRDALSDYRKARTKVSQEVLIAKTGEFSEYCAREATPLDKIPYPSTWLNDERWRNDYSDQAGKPPAKGWGSYRP